MLEGIIVFVLGSFVYDNLDFFHTAKNQMRDGYEWEMNIKERKLLVKLRLKRQLH